MAETTARSGIITTDDFMEKLRFNESGLIPAIAQQYDTNEVLMMAWMTKQTVIETIETGRACYWSRSRNAHWRKGDTSGHIQQVHSIHLDCDGDTILLKIDQTGTACHTGARSCFFMELSSE